MRHFLYNVSVKLRNLLLENSETRDRGLKIIKCLPELSGDYKRMS